MDITKTQKDKLLEACQDSIHMSINDILIELIFKYYGIEALQIYFNQIVPHEPAEKQGHNINWEAVMKAATIGLQCKKDYDDIMLAK